MQVWYCTGTPQDAAGPEVRNWVLNRKPAPQVVEHGPQGPQSANTQVEGQAAVLHTTYSVRSPSV